MLTYLIDGNYRPKVKKYIQKTKNEFIKQETKNNQNQTNQKNKLFSLKNFFLKLLFTLASLFVIFLKIGFFS